MVRSSIKRRTAVDRAAEGVGHALGRIAGTIESLQAEHPHPVAEAREAAFFAVRVAWAIGVLFGRARVAASFVRPPLPSPS